MGNLFRQKYKRKDGRQGESKKWYGEFTDHTGQRRRVPLSTDKAAAQAMLSEMIRQVERRRAGLIDEFTEAARTPLAELIDAYHADLKLRGRRERYRTDVKQLLDIIVPACGFETPGDIKAHKLDAYLAGMVGSARTKAKHRQAAVGFANWLVRKGKLAANPLAASTRPEGEAVRKRRALSADELRRLIEAATERPLREAMLIRWGPRKGLYERRLKPADVERLKTEGRNNALLYRTAFYTGFRAEELRSLWAGDLKSDGPMPTLFLPRERTKNKRDAVQPIPTRLADSLRAWIEERGIGAGEPIFKVPHTTAKLLRADLKAAGLKARDARGNEADFHSLRVSFATHLNKSGAPAAVAKDLMRHSTVKLTLDTYHDPVLNEVRSALDLLPDI